MPTLKEYQTKLNAMRNMRKIMNTMKMISANKLRRAQTAWDCAVHLEQSLLEMVAHATNGIESSAHPFLTANAAPRSALLLVITSDRGLCAGFNNNLNKLAMNWILRQETAGKRIELRFCGKRGYLFFRRRRAVGVHYEGVMHNPSFAEAARVAADLKNEFLPGRADEVYVAYNRFRSALSQVSTVEALLPVAVPEAVREGLGTSSEPIFEPDRTEAMEILLNSFLEARIFSAFLHSSAGEHGARMTAMDSATRNADEMIEAYYMLRNRARQAAITRDLIEIISGAEALRTSS